ncbi:MAG TPA: hypothetical protein VN646_04585 [Candidatus Acidoferrum sp.]|jgi:hypothetical protein|nr:hypothetical protein [Candidatus Acidoferrum sp.]
MNAPATTAFRQVPSLAVGGRLALAFTFIARTADTAGAIGLGALRAWLQGHQVHRALIEPAESFFRDITSVRFETDVPLVLAVEPKSQRRTVELPLPETIWYAAEGDRVDLRRESPAPRTLRFAYRDVFALFESGRIVYVFTLNRDDGTPLTEYDLIQLEKLVHPSEQCAHLRNELLWREPGQPPRTLDRLVQDRLGALGSAPRGDVNAVRDVFGDAEVGLGPVPRLTWAHLKSMCVMIDDRALYDRVTAALLTGPGSVAITEPRADGATLPHLAVGHTDSGRVCRAFAGIVQGVLDFPKQDEVELADSLKPFQQGDGLMMFAHPRFLIELCYGSRSFEKMEGVVGCCPYLLLSHLILVHNEDVLEEAETAFAALQGPRPAGARRYEPLADVGEMVARTERWLFEPPTRVRRENLQQRIALFRSLVLGYVSNVFRYPSERKTYDGVSESRGLSRRHAGLLDRFERYEKLVGDAWDLGSGAAERRINRLLILLAGLSFISAVADFGQFMTQPFWHRVIGMTAVGLALSAVIVVALAPSVIARRRRGRRSRGAPRRGAQT